MKPGMIIVEISFSCVVGLVGKVVEMEQESQVSKTPHLKLGRVFRVSAIKHYDILEKGRQFPKTFIPIQFYLSPNKQKFLSLMAYLNEYLIKSLASFTYNAIERRKQLKNRNT